MLDLRCSCGQVEIQWRVRSVAGASRKLAVVWSENGGPEVKHPWCRGFGTQLLKRAIEGYGAVQLYFNKTGLACSMLIELDHVETPFHSQHPHEQFGINGGGARVRNAAWPNMRPQCGDGIDFKRMRDRIGAELPRAESGSRSIGSPGTPESVARKIAATAKALGISRFDRKYSAGPRFLTRNACVAWSSGVAG